jgi:hypothetical protein
MNDLKLSLSSEKNDYAASANILNTRIKFLVNLRAEHINYATINNCIITKRKNTFNLSLIEVGSVSRKLESKTQHEFPASTFTVFRKKQPINK